MNPKRRRKMQEAEEAWGRPFWDLVLAWAAQGKSKQAVAELLGYSTTNFARLLQSADAPRDIPWAPVGQRRGGPKEWTEEARRNVREGTRRQARVQWLTIDGDRQPLTVWAERAGLNPETIRRRMRRGLEGRALISPPMSRRARGERGMRVRYGRGDNARHQEIDACS